MVKDLIGSDSWPANRWRENQGRMPLHYQRTCTYVHPAFRNIKRLITLNADRHPITDGAIFVTATRSITPARGPVAARSGRRPIA